MSKVFLGALAIGSLMLAPAYAGQKGKPAATPHGNPHTTTATTGASTTASVHGNSHRPATSATTAGTTTPRATTTTSTATTTTNSPIATKIASKPQLASRLERLLPPGTTLARASSGFKNQGQFIAALHVSQNLHIPFADLKRAMTGTNSLSLGQSIQKLRPSANSTTEAAHAETQATTDLRVTTTSAPSTTAAASTTTTKKHRGR
jgi:hypothetical protein